MVGEADVTIRYAFLPTKESIKKSISQITNQINNMAGQPITKATAKKLNTQSNKTVEQVVNFLRATQIKTSLQTKIMAGLNLIGDSFSDAIEKFNSVLINITKWTPAIGPTGIGKGEGGEVTEQAGPLAVGAGGGVMGTLGLILGVLIVISAVMMLIGAFFDAVGPIIKVVMKMLSAIILILLMPFLKRGLPLLFGIMKWLIEISKGISNIVEGIFQYFEGIGGAIMSGDLTSILSAIFGPISNVLAGLAGNIWTVVGNVLDGFENWVNEMEPGFLKDALSFLVGALQFGRTVIEKFFTGEETLFDTILEGLDQVAIWMGVEGVWSKIKKGLEWVNTDFFGTGGIWNVIKAALDAVKISLDESWGDIIIHLRDIGNSLLAAFNAINAALAVIDAFNPISIGMRAGKSMVNDFISRPGMGTQSFSPDDTIIGIKNPSSLGGTTINTTLNVSSGVDKKEFRKLLTEFGRQQGRELRTRTSYYGR